MSAGDAREGIIRGKAARGRLGGKLAGLSLPRQIAVIAFWPFLEQLLSFFVTSSDLFIATKIGVDAQDTINISDGMGAVVFIMWFGFVIQGAGMINPCMATMLCFITTDAGVSRDVLELCVQSGVKSSFNCITIDGDMSTNDTVLVMANGASGVKLETPEDIYAFQQALAHVMLELAKHIVQDGERVTKFVTVHVTGGRTEDEAKKAAEAVAKSSLVKSSWNGNDPNWGRIIHAVGYCGAKVDEEKIDIDIAGLAACRGGVQADTPSDDLRQAVQVPAFQVDINLNRGEFSHTVYTTDLSPEYVDFNRSEYAYWNQAKADGLTC